MTSKKEKKRRCDDENAMNCEVDKRIDKYLKQIWEEGMLRSRDVEIKERKCVLNPSLF